MPRQCREFRRPTIPIASTLARASSARRARCRLPRCEKFYPRQKSADNFRDMEAIEKQSAPNRHRTRRRRWRKRKEQEELKSQKKQSSAEQLGENKRTDLAKAPNANVWMQKGRRNYRIGVCQSCLFCGCLDTQAKSAFLESVFNRFPPVVQRLAHVDVFVV